jgi:hypothetical protein
LRDAAEEPESTSSDHANRGLYRSWKNLAVAPSANNRGLIVFKLAESPRREDLRRNSGSGRYLSIASSVCRIADGETRNRPE